MVRNKNSFGSLALSIFVFVGLFILSVLLTPESTAVARSTQLSSNTSSNKTTTVGPFRVEGGTEETDFTYSSSTLTIKSGSLTIATTSKTNERIVVSGASIITLSGVDIETTRNAALSIKLGASFNTTILLADDSSNVLKSGSLHAGLEKPVGSAESAGKLIIGCPEGSKGNGKLEAIGGESAAGIGGNSGISASNIIINGGTIHAKGGMGGAGIGGGLSGDAISIEINGGDIVAEGGIMAAGIGGGMYSNANDVFITAGKVVANGGPGGAGVGCGANCTSGPMQPNMNIVVSGGVLQATGGHAYDVGSDFAGAAIGSGGGADAESVRGNYIKNNAVVLAVSGGLDGSVEKPALNGFGEGDSNISQGIVFTGTGVFNDSFELTGINWNDSGIFYGTSVAVEQSVEFPANVVIADYQSLTLTSSTILSVLPSKTIKNEGALNIYGEVHFPVSAEQDKSGQILTKMNFSVNPSDAPYESLYQIYKTAEGIATYRNLPKPKSSDSFGAWHYFSADGSISFIQDGDYVLLNEHDYFEVAPKPGSNDGWVWSNAGWQYAVDGAYVTGWRWVDDAFGAHWYYFNEDTYMACSQWQWDEENSSWYWLCSSGPMIKGFWQWIDNEWYGFWWDGKMCRGWVWDAAWQAWFYCYSSGIMARSTWEGPYWLNWEGIWLH